MPIERGLVLFAAFVLAACEPVEPVPFAIERDSGRMRPDGGPVSPRVDSGRRDGGPRTDGGGADLDAALFDAALADAALFDAGAAMGVPMIDGVIDPLEWADALVATSMTMPVTPFEGDVLRRLLVLRTSTHLYVAVEGTREPTHSIVVYVDADTGEDRGLLLISGTELSDPTGLFDRALSTNLTTSLPTLRIDYAWGTTQMPAGPTGSLDEIGWRDIATRPSDFVTLSGGASVTQCSSTACETSIAFGAEGIDRATSMTVFARVSDGMGNVSNQTLPEDDARAPELVSVVLEVPEVL